jgi:hypothetical protein
VSAPAVIQIGKPDELNRLTAVAASLGLIGRVELLRAVRDGRINIAEPHRDTPVPTRILKCAVRPLMAILGDDDDFPTGPGAWATLPRVLRWARVAMVHATGATVESYRFALGATVLHRRFLLIETTSSHGEAWARVMKEHRIPTLLMRPTGDGVHPKPDDRRAAH